LYKELNLENQVQREMKILESDHVHHPTVHNPNGIENRIERMKFHPLIEVDMEN